MAYRDELEGFNPAAERAKEAAAAPKAKAPRAPKPKVSKEQAAANRATKAKQVSASIGQATKKRRAWEGTEVGQKRGRDITDLATEEHNGLAMQHLDKMTPSDRIGINPAQIHMMLNTHNPGHGHGDQQLPGMENPHAAPEPARFEDLSPKHQAGVHEKLRQQGTSIGQMSHDFGAQFDQSIWRAHQAGHHETYEHPIVHGPTEPGGHTTMGSETRTRPVPFTQHFYGEHPDNAPEPLDRPKEMMRESRRHLAAQAGLPGGQIAADNHTDPMLHTAAIGHVSPNVKFTQGERGARTSPNIEAAEAVFRQHEQGIEPQMMDSGRNRAGARNQSRPANSVRAGMMMKHVAAGGSLATARNAPSKSSPKGSSQWGPKTGPFTNSFDAQHPDYLVADVHTGGGGMLPHLGTKKDIRINTDGTKARMKDFRDDPRSDAELLKTHRPRDVFYPGKSDREKGIESGGVGATAPFHSAADHAARQAIASRGLGTSVRTPQAAQWGEEQIQRKEASPKLDVPSHADAYPPQHKPPVSDSQFKLF
jgi:hypothetical protein